MVSDGFARIGDVVKLRCDEHDVLGIICAARMEAGPPPREVVVIELFGQLSPVVELPSTAHPLVLDAG